MVQGHDSETAADQDCIDPADGIDQRGVFLVSDAEGLEGALEAMDQVDGQGEDTDQVDDDDPDILEGYIDAAVDVLDGFVVAGIGDHGELIGKAHLDPEVAHVKAQEGEDEDAEQGHVFRRPGGAGDFAVSVFAAFSASVHQRESDSLDGVEYDKGVQAQGDDQDKLVFGHEGRVDIEGPAAVVREELEVAGHMDDEEEDQEEAGEAHDDFLAQARGKETGYPVHS